MLLLLLLFLIADEDDGEEGERSAEEPRTVLLLLDLLVVLDTTTTLFTLATAERLEADGSVGDGEATRRLLLPSCCDASGRAIDNDTDVEEDDEEGARRMGNAAALDVEKTEGDDGEERCRGIALSNGCWGWEEVPLLLKRVVENVD